MNVRLRIMRHLFTIGVLSASVGSAWAQSAADGFNPGANGVVYAIAVQPDGKILVGGAFTMLGGGGSGTVGRNYIGRLNPDGSLDATFNPGANATVYDIAVQADGKILVGGQFTTMGGGGTGSTARLAVARLNPDGSLDPGFNPGKGGLVHSIVVQPDGKIVMAGLFDMYSGGSAPAHHNIARVDQNGMFDDAFNPGSNDGVTDMALQPDGKIIVVGFFTALGGGTGTTTRNHIGRINADGSLDVSFDVGAGNLIEVVALQPDGKIVVGGTFGYLECPAQGFFSRSFLGRLNPDGTVDTSFDTGTGNWVSALAVPVRREDPRRGLLHDDEGRRRDRRPPEHRPPEPRWIHRPYLRPRRRQLHQGVRPSGRWIGPRRR